MKITKFGQCCLLVEVEGKRILTDPGKFSVSQNQLRDIDLVLITHEHSDHLHTESIKEIVHNNPEVKIVTNSSVAKILHDLGIDSQVLEGRSVDEVGGISVEAFDGKHEEIFEEYGQVQNTGYFIAEKLFYPGDAYTEPGREVEILALPVAGPWCKCADALSYAIRVMPEVTFPVHDWLLNEDGIALTYGIFESQLKSHGIQFVRLTNDETKEF
jgi:L-ascorbate metabolism protein UlaG (beta-lactamase superfamily)